MNEIQKKDIERIFDAQGENRWKIAQTTAKERIEKLKKLRDAVIQRQVDFYNAVWLDFHKPKFEAWLSEVFPIIEEIDYTISHLNRWMKDKKASRVFFLPTSKSVLHYEPKGRVLIFSPWNYPYLLLVNPIISAIAAGNVIMAKPSHKTPHVSAFLAKLFADTFPENEIAIIEGKIMYFSQGVQMSAHTLQKWQPRITQALRLSSVGNRLQLYSRKQISSATSSSSLGAKH